MEYGAGGNQEARSEHLARNLDAASVLLQTVTTEIKNAAVELSRLHSDVRILAFRVEEHAKVLSAGSGLLVRIHDIEAKLTALLEDTAGIRKWIETHSKAEQELRNLITDTEQAKAEALQAHARVEEENAKRRWGFWTAIGTGVLALLSQAVQWMMKM